MRILDDEHQCDLEAEGCGRGHSETDSEAPSIASSASKGTSRLIAFFGSWKFWAGTSFLVALIVLVILNKPETQVEQQRIRWESSPFNATRAIFISMKPSDPAVSEQIHVLKDVVGFRDAEVLAAVNGKSVDRDTLPLYTRYLMEQGRHDHHQVSTSGMVGCYLSHIRAMEMMMPGDIFAIFEEDARFEAAGALQLKQLHDFVGSIGLEYSAIMIGINRVPRPSGETYTMPVADGLDLVGCTKDCTMWGTRGYILTYAGAQKILKHAYPIQTQIDALISLVARYDRSFKLFWTAQDVALGPPLLAIVQDIHYSQVQDHCLKCHLPNSNVFYIVLIVLLVMAMVAAFCFLTSRGCWARRSFALEVCAPVKETAVLLMLSPRGDVSAPASSGTMPKLDEDRDQVQVQVQSSAVPQVLPAACNLQMCHRRTGSRDGEATFLSTLAGEHQQSLHFSSHRRTGSRDVNVEAASAVADVAVARPAEVQAGSG